MRYVNVASKGEDKGEEEENLFVVSARTVQSHKQDEQ